MMHRVRSAVSNSMEDGVAPYLSAILFRYLTIHISV